MSNTNDFVGFGLASGANVLSPSAYASATVRQQGVQAGTASSTLANTAWRQASTIAAMIGQFTADYGPSNVQDNGNISALEGQFIAALTGIVTAIVGPDNLYTGTDTGTADAIHVTTMSPGLAAYANNQVYLVEIGATNLTATPQFQVASLPQLPVLQGDGTQVPIGFLQNGRRYLFTTDGSNVFILGTSRSGNPPQNAVVCRSTTTYIVPSWCNALRDVHVWGGGGGGGGVARTNGSAAGGGGGGYSYQAYVPVEPGQAILMSVGAGGLGGGGATYGQQGGTSTVNVTSPISASGGNGGFGQGVDNPGLGGVGSGGDLNLRGHPGGGTFAVGGNTSGLQPGGGAGGAAPFGGPNTQLALAGDTGGDGAPGEFPAGGGGGACCAAAATYNGGDGAAGMIVFSV